MARFFAWLFFALFVCASAGWYGQWRESEENLKWARIGLDGLKTCFAELTR